MIPLQTILKLSPWWVRQIRSQAFQRSISQVCMNCTKSITIKLFRKLITSLTASMRISESPQESHSFWFPHKSQSRISLKSSMKYQLIGNYLSNLKSISFVSSLSLSQYLIPNLISKPNKVKKGSNNKVIQFHLRRWRLWPRNWHKVEFLRR